MKITFQKIVQTLSGMSGFGFGVSWNPPRFEADVARDLLTFLEDRRVLYNPLIMEEPKYLTKSVLEIRQRLTEDIQKVDANSELAKILRTMRAACRNFMDEETRNRIRGPVRQSTSGYAVLKFMVPLMDLRAILGTCIEQLCVRYKLDLDESLATMVPSLQTAKLMEASVVDHDG